MHLALAAFLLLFMRERRFQRWHRASQRTAWRDLGVTMLAGLRLVRARVVGEVVR